MIVRGLADFLLVVFLAVGAFFFVGIVRRTRTSPWPRHTN